MHTIRTHFILFILLICFQFIGYSQQKYFLGALPEEPDTIAHPYKEFPDLRSPLPESHDLSYLLPEIGNQGWIGSCVSWASAYYAFTIVRRIEENNINYPAFSPIRFHSTLKLQYEEWSKDTLSFYDYSLVKDCEEGSYTSDAADRLVRYGAPFKGDESLTICSQEDIDLEYSDRLYSWQYIDPDVDLMKQALCQNSPLVFSIDAYNKDCWSNDFEFNKGVWNGLISGGEIGGHAMCIVGYDDEIGTNGAFKVVNSWSDEWGEDGFFWIQYNDVWWIHNVMQYELNPFKNRRLPGERISVQKIDKANSLKIKEIYPMGEELVISMLGGNICNYDLSGNKVYRKSLDRYSLNFQGVQIVEGFVDIRGVILSEDSSKISLLSKENRTKSSKAEFLINWLGNLNDISRYFTRGKGQSYSLQGNKMNGSRIRDFGFFAFRNFWTKDQLAIITDLNKFIIWNTEKSEPKIILNLFQKRHPFKHCVMDPNIDYIHGICENGQFFRYELAWKNKRISTQKSEIDFDLILPNHKNVIGLKGNEIYKINWDELFPTTIWQRITGPLKKHDIYINKYDIELLGEGTVSQVQFESSSNCLLALKGNMINAIDLENNRNTKIKIDADYLTRIFLNADKREIICHYDKTFLIYNFYTGDEILRIENIENIWLGVGDTLNDNPLKRKVRKDLDYTVGVDSDGNILLINM